jgi:hypothetical protein
MAILLDTLAVFHIDGADGRLIEARLKQALETLEK